MTQAQMTKVYSVTKKIKALNHQVNVLTRTINDMQAKREKLLTEMIDEINSTEIKDA